MKSHRYAAILVFVASAAWVLTGDFSSVGSASDQADGDQATTGTPVIESTADDAATNSAPVQSVVVATIPSIDHMRTVRVSGVTQADKRTNMTARAGGVISELLVEQGDTVSKDDVIARIAPEGRDAAVRSAEAALEQARAEFGAREELVERGTLPRLQLDQQRSALRLAESQYEAAVAELDRLDVKAPFGGVVDNVMVEEGGAVDQGTPVGNLIALDPIIGIGEVNESDLRTIRVGGDAQLRLVTGEMIDGTIRFISRDAQASTRTFTVEVEAPNPDLVVPAGMTAEVILRGQPVVATPVPRSVVTLDDAGELGVRAVDDDNIVVFYPIDLVDDSTDALLLGGIPRGARIIVVGQNFVSDGQTVAPVEADSDVISRLVAEANGEAAGQ
ncbi:MAG: efflux RND transporter periplasmic adaptor subunit [Roseitalea sp.]|jgi:multidrug efflux system membrane fusion protein|nr:efflux RND transporter periplasmic adaptor subunit [Roseitalea sp.]MBO6720909.1 efflux RND transporter periplasmic adaptor subunit [Roseitalea sp.]MBO6743214.1 efflux RND transporter periplasmic adaptor subunit [Roseitalea sp.]